MQNNVSEDGKGVLGYIYYIHTLHTHFSYIHTHAYSCVHFEINFIVFIQIKNFP